MSFWNGDHPMQWKYQQVEKALPAFGASDNENFSDSTNEDLTEAANLICLVYDYYNNGSLAANIEVRLSRYMEECKHGAQFCKDWFDQVMYWYENDCMPSDKEQAHYCTRWLESMLESLDFEYEPEASEAKPEPKASEPSKPKPKPKRKRAEVPEPERKVRKVEPKVEPEASKPEPKVPKVPKAPKVEPKVTRQEFAQYTLFQMGALPMPQWFMTDDAKASEIMNKYNELANIYN